MAQVSEEELLREALDLADASVTFVSREPLGKGAVTGFDVAGVDVAKASAAGPETADSETADSETASSERTEAAPLRYYVDTSRLAVAQETGLALGQAERPDVRIWLHPADPHLPILPAVAFHHAAASLLTRLGLEADSPPEFVGYRAGRRAVLRMPASSAGVPRTMWVKIVRPRRVQRIASTHEAVAHAGLPVPALAAWSPEGVLILESALGTPAPGFPWRPDDLLDEADRLMAQFTSVEVTHATKGVAGRLGWYSELLAAVASPELGARIERITAEIYRALRAKDSATPASRTARVVHGDLHFGQLFLDGAGKVTGIIDVDTVGVGDSAEDPAAFIAHATASALMTAPPQRSRVWALADGATERWGDDSHVRTLFGVHMLGHCLGSLDLGNEEQALRLLAAATSVLAGGLPSQG